MGFSSLKTVRKVPDFVCVYSRFGYLLLNEYYAGFWVFAFDWSILCIGGVYFGSAEEEVIVLQIGAAYFGFCWKRVIYFVD
jgi:hypothetical protein